MALLLGVCFSMNTAINSSNSISRASTRARLSALILPSAHSDSKRAFSASNSARSEDLFTVAIAAGLPLGLDRHHRPQHREALGHRQRRVAPAPALGLALDALAVGEVPPRVARPVQPVELWSKVVYG